MNLHEFVTAHIDDEARTLVQITEAWEREQPNRHFEFPLSNYISRYNPDAVMRGIDAARAVLGRHLTTDDPRWTQHCNGCPGDADGFPSVPIEECEELQGLAWRWNYDPDWDRRWCPHYETDRHELTSQADPRRVYQKTCRHCGVGLGRTYGDLTTTDS